MTGAHLNMTGWTMVLADATVPNPVVAERYTRDDGIARVRANGMVDAIDGTYYSISPGFDSYAELDAWILEQEIANLVATLHDMQEHPYRAACGEADALYDKLHDRQAELDRVRGGFADFQEAAYSTVGAIWLDDGTLAGWQLSLDVDAERQSAQRLADYAAETDTAYMATQAGRWLSEQDEIIDHD